ncbi:hypothetical protein FB567DRAFT_586304 [Paraphoma chrysanthemicola]|uniref:Uncharacterized protein n=1 Tax=Paraphoma chrysanthemicola TaxID=798071 RepID=A0A8K0RKD5_9PLEO|nr:hypothetical protein FB567DRAFT_586304 [Paraphoma chrysanthemicola]
MPVPSNIIVIKKPIPNKPSTPAKQSPPSPLMDFPYKWEDVSSKLLLASPKELPKLILAPAFLTPWTTYRDTLPLQPGVPVPSIIAPKDKEAMNDLINTIYTAMDAMHASKFDRPDSDRTSWSQADSLSCIIYQSARSFAAPAQIFHTSFERKNLKNEAGRREATMRIRGLIMLTCNLVVNYTFMSPSNVVRRIEAVCPALRPDFSPIVETRRKWELANLGLEDLRRAVLDGERKGGVEEREWLIGILLQREKAGVAGGLDVGIKSEGGKGAAVGVKSEGGVQGVARGSKRKAVVIEDDEVDVKKVKTVVEL